MIGSDFLFWAGLHVAREQVIEVVLATPPELLATVSQQGRARVTMPVLLLVTLWPLGALLDPAHSPRFQRHLFAIGFIAGNFEKVGWTGFATPRPLRRPLTSDAIGEIP